MINLLIAAGSIGLTFLFITWADRKKRRDQRRQYPSAMSRKLDDHEEKISS